MRFANATPKESLAQIWHDVTLTACSPMLKSYCWAQISQHSNTLHEFCSMFADAALTCTSACTCAFPTMFAADMQVVIEEICHKSLPEII